MLVRFGRLSPIDLLSGLKPSFSESESEIGHQQPQLGALLRRSRAAGAGQRRLNWRGATLRTPGKFRCKVLGARKVSPMRNATECPAGRPGETVQLHHQSVIAPLSFKVTSLTAPDIDKPGCRKRQPGF